MNARHLHPSARKNSAAVQCDPGTAAAAASPADLPAGASVLAGTSPDVASWIREAA